LAAMDYALKQFGTMSFAQVMAPAIDRANRGFNIDALFAGRIAVRSASVVCALLLAHITDRSLPLLCMLHYRATQVVC
jgi:hypothetical protein